MGKPIVIVVLALAVSGALASFSICLHFDPVPTTYVVAVLIGK